MRVFKRASRFLLIATLLSACSSVQIVPLTNSANPTATYPPTSIDEVGVYMNWIPFPQYNEIAIITASGGVVDLDSIYSSLRQEAAAKGAQAIIGLKLAAHIHQEPVETTTCDADGNCTTTTTWESVRTYNVSGTMIRRKE